MNWFKINGKSYNVRVLSADEDFQILYSENTGRTLDSGAPMVLDPYGTFFNYTIVVAEMQGYEDDFETLWTLLSKPNTEGVLLQFPRGRTELWETEYLGATVDGFYAYVSSGDRKFKKIVEDDDGNLKDVIYDTFSIKFTAMKAQVLPDE